MRTLGLLAVCGALGVAGMASGQELPPAAQETIAGFEKDIVEISKKTEEDVKKAAEKAAAGLKPVLQEMCKQAKLDEALAVREQMRRLLSATPGERVAGLPPAAVKVMDAFDRETADGRNKLRDRLRQIGDKADEQLKAVQDRFCRDGKLDEAAAVRDARRLIRLGVTNVKPDPGYVHAEAADVGKVWYFEVVGSAQGATWGTDVYTTDTSLAVTAVHAGVLKPGEKGVVKVTILPGQANYPGSTRNGVTSHNWGEYYVSFKVERPTPLAGVAPRK